MYTRNTELGAPVKYLMNTMNDCKRLIKQSIKKKSLSLVMLHAPFRNIFLVFFPIILGKVLN